MNTKLKDNNRLVPFQLLLQLKSCIVQQVAPEHFFFKLVNECTMRYCQINCTPQITIDDLSGHLYGAERVQNMVIFVSN